MESKLAILAASLLVLSSTLAGTAAGQENNQTPNEPGSGSGNPGGAPTTTVTIVGNEKTASNEMGSTKMLNQIEVQEGCTPVETLVHFNTYLKDRNAAFFMFQVIWNSNPYQVSNINLTTVDGTALPLYQQGDEGGIAYKLVVLARDMPTLGTDLRLTFDVCSSVRGLFTVGTLVIVFDETWTKVKLSGGIDAEIYNEAKLLVMSGEAPASDPPGLLNVPTVGAPVFAAILGAAALALRNRRRMS